MDVADESGQAEQSEQAEDFGESDDAQGPGCSVHLGVKAVHHQEDVVHRDGRHKVHQEPALQVVLADGPALRQDGRAVTFGNLAINVCAEEVTPTFVWLDSHPYSTGTELECKQSSPAGSTSAFHTDCFNPADGQKSTFKCDI